MLVGDLSKPWVVALAVGAASSSSLLSCGAGGSRSGEQLAPDANEPPGAGGSSSAGPEAGGAGIGVIPGPASPSVIFNPDDTPMPAAAPGPSLRRRGLVGKQVSCDGAATTSVSGTVYIPSGQLPLYNAMVYVPETELAPLTPGASCSCEISGEPIVSALTDSAGRFVLENVPVGDDIPLVIQVGDWRREFNIGSVEPCVETRIADRTLKLPARQSEGDLPRIAVATGRLDALECLVRKLGVDTSEFTNGRGGGRVELFAGYGGTPRYSRALGGEDFAPAEALWYDAESLAAYDIVLLSCEGDPRGHLENKDERALQGMFDYANLGGRLFASHFQGIWFKNGPAPFPELAEFTSGNDDDYDTLSAQVVTSFPKGQALAEWVVSNGTSAAAEVPIRGGAHTIVKENTAYAQRWLDTTDPASVQYISANTPLGVADEQQCGRVVLSDIHVSPGDPGDDYSDPNTDFPEGCVSPTLSPQEAVLAFMLFDISACIVPDSQAPVAPPIIR